MPYWADPFPILPRAPQTQIVTVIDGQRTTILGSGTATVEVPSATVFPVSLTSSASASSSLPSEEASSSSQPIPKRTLIAVCVAAGVLLAGIVIFVLLWDKSKKKKSAEGQAGEDEYSQEASTQDMKLKGLHGVHASAPPPPGSLSQYSASNTAHDSGHRGGYDNDIKHPPMDAVFAPVKDTNYAQEDSFLSLRLSRTDPARPQTASPITPPHSVPQSPRSASAQPITHPYSVGAHPYASPSISHSPLYRPSFERTATSTTAIAASPDPDPSIYSVQPGLPPPVSASASAFAGAGSRPGFDAYGFEPRTGGGSSSNHGHGRTGSIGNRPSIESIRSIARKGSASNLRGGDQPQPAPAYPPTGGFTRPRNNSTSTYAGSIRGGGKAKPTKEEKARELAAMDNLIAALDESAEAERRRKDLLVAAAGITDDPFNTNSVHRDAAAGSSRRKDTAVTGSYPLPPPEVFRAALGGGRMEDEPDEEEIARWRR